MVIDVLVSGNYLVIATEYTPRTLLVSHHYVEKIVDRLGNEIKT